MNISNRSIERLVEEQLEQDGKTVNFVEVQTSLNHGDSKLFSVRAYTEEDGQEEYTVSIDIRKRVE